MLLEYVKTNKEYNFIRIEMLYFNGEYDYKAQKKLTNGYYLCISPVERKPNEYGMVFEYSGFESGYKVLLTEANRRGCKLEEKARKEFARIKDYHIDKMLSSEGLVRG